MTPETIYNSIDDYEAKYAEAERLAEMFVDAIETRVKQSGCNDLEAAYRAISDTLVSNFDSLVKSAEIKRSEPGFMDTLSSWSEPVMTALREYFAPAGGIRKSLKTVAAPAALLGLGYSGGKALGGGKANLIRNTLIPVMLAMAGYPLYKQHIEPRLSGA